MDGARSLVCPILVGRDDLLDLADRRIREVAGGSGRFLLLAGEAGVGKTRTVAAHVEHILAKLAVARRAEIATWVASVQVLHSPLHGVDREE